MIKRARPTRPLPDPREVFTHGRRFLAAEEHIRLLQNTPAAMLGWVAQPAMVLSAFAAELFLKSLLILDGETPPDVHHLGTLYKRIHNKKKVCISALWNDAMSARASA